MRLGRLVRVALAAGLCLFVVSCGGSSETTESTESASVVTLSDIQGSWVSDAALLQVADDGSYQVFDDPAELVLPAMIGFVARQDDQLIFVTGVNGECPGQTGNYTAALDGDTLTLDLIDDPCAVRVDLFSLPFEKSG
jgi:hypothetical protein